MGAAGCTMNLRRTHVLHKPAAPPPGELGPSGRGVPMPTPPARAAAGALSWLCFRDEGAGQSREQDSPGGDFRRLFLPEAPWWLSLSVQTSWVSSVPVCVTSSRAHVWTCRWQHCLVHSRRLTSVCQH